MEFGRKDPLRVLRDFMQRREKKEPTVMGENISALRNKIQQKFASARFDEREDVGSEKVADLYQGSAVRKNPYILASDIAKGTAVGMAVGAGIKGIGTVLSHAVDRAYVGLTEGKDKAKAFSKMIGTSPELGKEPAAKVQRAFNSLYRWNPEMARDPLVASSFVQRTIDYGAVTTQEVESMIKSRKYLNEARGGESILGGAVQQVSPDDYQKSLGHLSVTNDLGWRR